MNNDFWKPKKFEMTEDNILEEINLMAEKDKQEGHVIRFGAKYPDVIAVDHFRLTKKGGKYITKGGQVFSYDKINNKFVKVEK
jgi:hypothetical protein